MVLCENCLETVETPVRKFPIGHDFGSQRDPERHELTLCTTCAEALTTHNLGLFAERYSSERRIDRRG